MRIETSFTIMGYPGIAMILFIIAIVGSSALAYKILVYDESTKKKDK